MRAPAPLFILLVSMVVAGCAESSGGAQKSGPSKDGDGFFVPGSIIDEQGLPVGNANVAVAHPSNLTVIRNATSDAQGKFRIGPIPVGDWVIMIDAKGFETFTRTIKITDDGYRGELRAPLRAIAIPVPFKESFPTTIHVQYGVGYQAGGDFNQG
ncbi:MAG TPA: carboxypeptidase-like regulatory domain-containing protein, partial [Candidatus Thermoplasmatota archaeon]|nr:carboxypeptidase-like regulatory domain-containing protein [Candidatus Thermoplasmatota archaeon]